MRSCDVTVTVPKRSPATHQRSIIAWNAGYMSAAAITENPTARLPSSTPLIGLGLSDIQLTAGNASLTPTLQPGGPPGPQGPSGLQIISSAGPPPAPASGWQFYTDTLDGNWLKVISYLGNVQNLFAP